VAACFRWQAVSFIGRQEITPHIVIAPLAVKICRVRSRLIAPEFIHAKALVISPCGALQSLTGTDTQKNPRAYRSALLLQCIHDINDFLAEGRR
jgi:hypothetical protein